MSQKTKRQKLKHHKNKAAAQSKKDDAAIVKELKVNPPTDFELQVGDGKTNEILNGDIQVRWCITDELIDALNDADVSDPHILLISTRKGGCNEMSRQLIPLTQLKTFVRCTNAGEVMLHAWIIDGSQGRKHINKKFMRRIGGSYDTDMLSYTGEAFTQGVELAKYASLLVTIPAGVFGKEPGPRMKWFVNLWHSSKIVDECNYRQRLILAFTLKWEVMIAYVIIASLFRIFVSLFVAGIGYHKNVNWRIVLQVFDFGISDIFSDQYHNNWFLNDFMPSRVVSKGYDGLTQRFVTFVPLIPSVVAVIYLLIYMGSNLTSFADHVVLLCLTLITMVKLTVAVDVIITLILWSAHTTLWDRVGSLWSFIDEWLSKRNYLGWNIIRVVGGFGVVASVAFIFYIYWEGLQWAAVVIGGFILVLAIMRVVLAIFYKFFTIDEKHNNINDVRELLCNDCDTAVLKGENRIVPFPSRQRRIKLLYLETKNKICKPMQR